MSWMLVSWYPFSEKIFRATASTEARRDSRRSRARETRPSTFTIVSSGPASLPTLTRALPTGRAAQPIGPLPGVPEVPSARKHGLVPGHRPLRRVHRRRRLGLRGAEQRAEVGVVDHIRLQHAGRLVE